MTNDSGKLYHIKLYDGNDVIYVGKIIIYLFLISEILVFLQMKEIWI